MKLCNDCKNLGKKPRCKFYGIGSNYAERCTDYEEHKQTQADRIRSLSDEELAEWLTKVTNDAQRDARTKCDYQWGEWLKSEVKE